MTIRSYEEERRRYVKRGEKKQEAVGIQLLKKRR